MPVSHHTLNQFLHHLSQVASVNYKQIFTGVGVYYQGHLFALVADNRLYFRVDESSVAAYHERAMPALKPQAAHLPGSHFYQLPDEVLHNPAELLYWMRAAVEASQPHLIESGGVSSSSLSPSQSSDSRHSLAG